MGILGILGSLSVITKFIPIVVAGVEALFPSSKGPEKLEQAVSILKLVAPQIFEDLEPEVEAEFIEGVVDIISGIVKVYNTIGVFKKEASDENVG